MLQLERNGALFGVPGLVRPKVLDTADMVRDGDVSPTIASQMWGCIVLA